MPELPEVEVARRALVRWLGGRKVIAAHADAKARTFRGSRVKDFEAIRGGLVNAERRGKYLLLTFEGGRGCVVHLGMTGKLVRRGATVDEPYSKARLLLDDRSVIHFRDPRRFGRIEPMPAGALLQAKAVQALGPDWLVDAPSVAQIKQWLGKSKRPIKVVLMDQGLLAGLGNIHAAEALFRARLHPGKSAAELSDDEWSRLHDGVCAALRYALEHEDGDEIRYVEEPGADNPFLIYGRAGEPCPTCRTTVETLDQGGRTTHFCPKCQAPRAGAAPKTAAKSAPKRQPSRKPKRRSKAT